MMRPAPHVGIPTHSGVSPSQVREIIAEWEQVDPDRVSVEWDAESPRHMIVEVK